MSESTVLFEIDLVAAGMLYLLFGVMIWPIIAAATLAASSVSVIGNALRLRRIDP